MYLALEIINSDSILNNFRRVGTAKVVRGSDAVVRFRVIQPDKDNIRYVVASGATLAITLNKSDGTTITPTLSHPFADDRSILEFSLAAADTATLISQNLNVEITEGGSLSIAVLQTGLQMINLNTDC